MTLFSLIKEDFGTVKRNDPALRSNVELFLNYPGLWAIFFHRFSHWFWQKNFRLLGRFISGASRFLTSVDIHPGAQVGRRVFLDHATGVVIGETTIIGDDVLIYQQVTLGGVSLSCGKRHPTVENGAVIGAGAKVLGNITIGREAKIGANSVVVTDVDAECTAVGVPAHMTRRIDNKIPLSHNVMPDINKELFEYLVKRIAVLEHTMQTGDLETMKKKDHELEEVYQTFLKSMKD